MKTIFSYILLFLFVFPFSISYSQIADAGEPQTVCNGSVNLEAENPFPATGKWRLVAGNGIISAPSLYQTTVTDLDAGENIFLWTVDNAGNITSDEVVITNYELNANAGENQMVCSTESLLTANLAPDGATGEWSIVSSTAMLTNPESNITGVTGLRRGSNIFKWRVDKDICHAESMVTISNNQFEVSASDRTVCGSSATLLAAYPGNNVQGQWELLSGKGSIANVSNYQTEVTGLQSGDNTFRWSAVSKGCTASAEIKIHNLKYAVSAGTDQRVCYDYTSLSAETPQFGSGRWKLLSGSGLLDKNISGENDQENKNKTNAYVYNLSPGTNVFRWTVDNNGCIAYDDVNIIKNEVNYSAGIDQVVCDGNTTLSADPLPSGATGVWTVDQGNAVFANASVFNTPVNDLYVGTNTLRWTVTENGCTGISFVRVRNSIFRVIANNGLNDTIYITNADNAQLDAVGQGAETQSKWTLVRGKGIFSDATDPKALVTDVDYGINTYRWTITKDNCSAYDDVILVRQGMNVFAGKDQNVCKPVAYLYADEPEVGQGEWSVIKGYADFGIAGIDGITPCLECTTRQNPAVYNLPKGETILRWTVTYQGYTEYDEIAINNYEFTIDAGEDRITGYDTITMKAEPDTYQQISGVGNWRVYSGSNNIANSQNHATKINNLNNGENIYIWRVTRHASQSFAGCSFEDTVSVIYSPNPPEIKEIPEQTAKQTTGYTAIDLSDYIGSETDISEIRWSAIQGENTVAGFDGNIAYFGIINPQITGSDTITIIATNTGGLTDSTRIVFVLEEDTSNLVEQLHGVSRVKIYPNPVTDKITIEYETVETGDIYFRLITADGRIVDKKPFYQSTGKISTTFVVSHLSKGIYYLQINNNKRVITKAVVIE